LGCRDGDPVQVAELRAEHHELGIQRATRDQAASRERPLGEPATQRERNGRCPKRARSRVSQAFSRASGSTSCRFFAAHWNKEPDDEDLLGQPGFDAFYRLSPSFGAALTVNTDFAETEVDQRRINLTRFPLFFPGETRLLLARRRHLPVRGSGELPDPVSTVAASASPTRARKSRSRSREADGTGG
jgi:hypothetical protein